MPDVTQRNLQSSNSAHPNGDGRHHVGNSFTSLEDHDVSDRQMVGHKNTAVLFRLVIKHSHNFRRRTEQFREV